VKSLQKNKNLTQNAKTKRDRKEALKWFFFAKALRLCDFACAFILALARPGWVTWESSSKKMSIFLDGIIIQSRDSRFCAGILGSTWRECCSNLASAEEHL
jgi:hypothetical protein